MKRFRKERPGYEQALDQFQMHGLPFPYIPPDMRSEISRLSEWVFGAGHTGRALFNIHNYQDLALARPELSYVLLGQAGYGTNSYGMHYYLARKPLYLFLQIAYGGVYIDHDQAIESMKERYTLALQLIKAMPAAVNRGALAPDERWIIVSSDFLDAYWIIADRVAGEDDEYLGPFDPVEVLDAALTKLVTAPSA